MFFVKAKFLNPQYYQDAIEERAIAKQCGFPICHKHIEKVLKQKYLIDVRLKKVYDVTLRKVCYFYTNLLMNKFYMTYFDDFLELLQ